MPIALRSFRVFVDVVASLWHRSRIGAIVLLWKEMCLVFLRTCWFSRSRMELYYWRRKLFIVFRWPIINQDTCFGIEFFDWLVFDGRVIETRNYKREQNT